MSFSRSEHVLPSFLQKVSAVFHCKFLANSNNQNKNLTTLKTGWFQHFKKERKDEGSGSIGAQQGLVVLN